MMRLARLFAVFVFGVATLGCGTPTTTIKTAAPTIDPVGQAIEQGQVTLYLQSVQQDQLRVVFLQALHEKKIQQARAARAASASRPIVVHIASVTNQGSHPCGGDLPPCWVMMRESHGDPRIWNGGCYAPVGWAGSRSPCGGSNASGKWQFMRSTWNNFCFDLDGSGPDAPTCYLNAADAPEFVQDAKARQVWANGAGRSHWGI